LTINTSSLSANTSELTRNTINLVGAILVVNILVVFLVDVLVVALVFLVLRGAMNSNLHVDSLFS
jgi:hypothetical protein